MRRLLIDANVYLEFFRFSKDDLDELRKVAELIRTRQLELYLTDQIRDEVRRNRERVLVQSFKSVEDSKVPSRFPQVLRNYERFSQLDAARQGLAVEIADLLSRARQDAAEGRLPADMLLVDLMALATDVPVTDSVMTAAKNRHERGNPPGKAGSYGDAIDWEALLAHHPPYETIDIISADADFRSPLRPRGLHEFLDQEWRSLKYSVATVYDDLSSFLRTHYPTIKISSEVASEIAVAQLEESGSYAGTHHAIAQLAKFADLSSEQVKRLADAALMNGQVSAILGDDDVHAFFSWLLDTFGHVLDPWKHDVLRERLK